MEPISNLRIDLSRIVPVETAECQAVVQLDAPVGNIKGGHGRGKPFAEILAQREIEGGVSRQIISGVRLAGKAVGETGAVVNVSGRPGAPGQGKVASDVQSVALVMIERTK